MVPRPRAGVTRLADGLDVERRGVDGAGGDDPAPAGNGARRAAHRRSARQPRDAPGRRDARPRPHRPAAARPGGQRHPGERAGFGVRGASGQVVAGGYPLPGCRSPDAHRAADRAGRGPPRGRTEPDVRRAPGGRLPCQHHRAAARHRWGGDLHSPLPQGWLHGRGTRTQWRDASRDGDVARSRHEGAAQHRGGRRDRRRQDDDPETRCRATSARTSGS